MNVKLVKLVSGEDFVAEITETEDGNIMAKNMIKLVPTRESMVMVPFNPLIAKDEKITFWNQHVMLVANVDEIVINAYKEQFGGVIVPANKLVLE